MDQKKQKTHGRPAIDDHIFGFPRNELLESLRRVYPEWLWHIGFRRLGDPHFRSEHPEFEIVSQWQPSTLR